MEEKMPRGRILGEIQKMFVDAEYGFEIYVHMKEKPELKRVVLYEGLPEKQEENFKKKVQKEIVSTIRRKYFSEDAEYELAENVADNQKKFYVIRQNAEYRPFEVLSHVPPEAERFLSKDIASADGLFFRFGRGERIIWAYQHIYPVSIPNKKRKTFLSVQRGDVFAEMKNPLFVISKNVDLLVIGEEIITDNIKLMQRYFAFQDFIKSSARESILNIERMGLVRDLEKMSDYIGRGQIRYSRKMMRIRNSKVLECSSDFLLDKIQTLPRWKGKFVIEDNKIVLNTYAQVESLIELFDETYTRSDVTGKEYETDVKRLAEPVG